MTNSRVLKTKGNKVTWGYKKGMHNGIDVVGTGSTLDYIVAHSDGTVVQARNNYRTTDTSGGSYGNYVLIKHTNGYYTLYAHMKYNSVTVKAGQKVKKGQTIGYMGNTGYAFGAHLHFEVRDKNNVIINPTAYINADLPSVNNNTSNSTNSNTTTLKHKTGETVSYNKIYSSSTSAEALKPAVSKGKITKIYTGTRNPYLIGDGIGFVNDSCITSATTNNTIKVGDKVKVLKAVQYNNQPFVKNYSSYNVIEIKGDRVVIGQGKVVTCAINIKDIQKV